ncbi:hypothetical protein ASE04_27600 [Rhizobium sp. Root708]|nr:hypothetical protein ASE04_27600 [Rhizobium sp. Root708]
MGRSLDPSTFSIAGAISPVIGILNSASFGRPITAVLMPPNLGDLGRIIFGLHAERASACAMQEAHSLLKAFAEFILGHEEMLTRKSRLSTGDQRSTRNEEGKCNG